MVTIGYEFVVEIYGCCSGRWMLGRSGAWELWLMLLLTWTGLEIWHADRLWRLLASSLDLPFHSEWG